MTNIIYKYELKSMEETLHLPINAEVLCVGEQEERLYIWIMQSAALKTDREYRKFKVIPTGQQIELTKEPYIGTVIMYRGRLVWHIFEVDVTYTIRKLEQEQ